MSAERQKAYRERKRLEGKLPELYDLGYEGQPFPGGTNEECGAWAEGVWRRQAEQTRSTRKRVPVPK